MSIIKRSSVMTIAMAIPFLAFTPSTSEEDGITPMVMESKVDPMNSLNTQVPATLIEVIDGDTIKVRVNGKVETVRYLLIDTPETKHPNRCVQTYANEAYFRNSELVKRGKLTLEFELGNTRDSYGRLLAYVFVDGESIQETLLKKGYARVAYVMNPPYKYIELFREDENLARKEKVNIWSMGDFVTNKGFNGCLRLNTLTSISKT